MDSLRSPLTPDVRPGCAVQSSVLTAARLQGTSSRVCRHPRTASTPTLHRAARSHPALRSSSVIRPGSRRVFPEHNGVHPTPATARPLWLAVPRALRYRPSGSLRPVAPPTSLSASPQSSRSRGHHQSVRHPLRLNRRHPLERPRETRNAQLRRTGGLWIRTPNSAQLRSRTEPFPRASAATATLNPPRFHSAGPNPGVQWTRCARH